MKYSPKTFFLFFLSIFLFLFFSCGQARYSEVRQFAAAMDAAAVPAAYSEQSASLPIVQRDMPNLFAKTRAEAGEAPLPPAEPEEAPPLSAGGENAVQSRKLIKNAHLRVRVEDTEAAEKPVNALAEKYGAWFASASVYENSRHYVIRVPAANFDAMLADVAAQGKLLERTENAEDVTLRYYDLESRLATKRELLKTYQSYLGRANNIEEIMIVEKHIAELQQEIDWTGTEFRNLSGQIDYSTINLEIEGPAGNSSYSRPTLKDKLGELFGTFGDTASSALVVLAGIVIYGVPAVLVFILLFWLLFGRVGLLKKLFRAAAGKDRRAE